MSVSFTGKLNLELTIKEGEKLRLSEDVVKSHYKSQSYMSTLASKNGLKVVGNWTESTGLLSSMVLEIDRNQSAAVKISGK